MIRFNSDDYFILYSNCIPVKGAKRSVICDLQNNKYFFIPNDLYDILQKTKSKKIKDIYNLYDNENKEVLDEYLSYLISENLAFIDAESESFPSLNLQWKSPSEITNSIIDFDNTSITELDYESIIQELSSLNCKCIQFRCFEKIDENIIVKILELTNDTRINEVRFYLKYNTKLDTAIKKKILKKYNRLTEVAYFDCKENIYKSEYGVRLLYSDVKNISNMDCGIVCKNSFIINKEFFTEAKSFNTCLNRKISIDKKGFIKNCPSQIKSFGNIKTKTFNFIINNNKEFKDLWNVNKDQVEVCKDCEFRYICTDCRVFTENEGSLSKPAKCKYDPYTATWS